MLVVLALAATVVWACRPAPADAPDRPTDQGASNAGAAATSTSAAADPAAPATPAVNSAAATIVDGSGTDTTPAAPPLASRDGLARHLQSALDANDEVLVAYTLGQVARGMSSYRGTWGEPMTLAIRRFAQADQLGMWERLDSRTIIAVLEFLLDAQDWAAIDRLTRHFDRGVGAPQVAGYAAIVSRNADRTGVVRVTGCEATIDGAPASELPRLAGTWQVACVGGPPTTAVVLRGGVTTVTAQDGVIAHLDEQPAPPTTAP